MKNRIKIFLGGYVNYLNAQNINCRALSEHLDKERFKVTTMLFPIQNAMDFKPVCDVKYLQLRRPVRLWRYLIYLRGIALADVAYLPKGEIDDYCRFIAWVFHTKVFTTVEGMIDDLNINLCRMSDAKRSKYIKHFAEYEPNLYAITDYISKAVGKLRGYNFCKHVLYLGVESQFFESPTREYKGLKDIIFIGSTPSIKNINDFFEIASLHTDIQFHIVGGNELKDGTVEDYIEAKSLKNVTYHGRLDHTKLSQLLKKIDLMFFPSRSEGFPKVHLETASAGVPTLCYGDYGADEWITSWHDGIVVKTFEEAKEAIVRLKDDPELLESMSKNAAELGRKFDWKNLTPVWENEIEKIYNRK